MTLGVKRNQRKGIGLALLNAFVIAGYTLVDGIGVRRSGSPAAYGVRRLLAACMIAVSAAILKSDMTLDTSYKSII